MRSDPAPALSSAEFRRIRALIERHAGLQLDDTRGPLVHARLSSRLRALSLTSFAQYCERVQIDPAELDYLVGALTTHVTDFFREPHHFDFLRRVCVPRWQERNQRAIRIWSAGCSSGQEAYSIAIVLRDALPESASREIRIAGWDIDANVVKQAQTGVYTEKQVAHVSEALRRRHFLHGTGTWSGKYKVKPQLSAIVKFEKANLLGAWPNAERFDAIFCRNVLIYFSKAQVLTLCGRFAERLKPDGHLFLGHSENISELREILEPAGLSVFRKRAQPREIDR